VAYNQSCDNACIPLIQNINLQLTEINEEEPIPLVDAFREDYVSPWIATINSAHLAYVNGSIPCDLGDYSYDINNLPFNCLFSRWTPNANNNRGYLEEVAQEVDFIVDDSYSYCINIDVNSLNCEENSSDGRIVVRTGDDNSVQQFFYESVPLNLPGIGTDPVGEFVVPAQGESSFSMTFFPQLNNSHLRIANAKDTPGRSFVSIEEAKVTCETTSIIDIDVTQIGEEVSFEAVNSSPFAYTSYGWTFGDGNSGGSANPSHVYDEPGEYEVCVNIFDENKCCGSFCKDIMVSISPSCPMDEETIFIDATNPMTNSFSDFVSMGMYQSGGTLMGKDIVVKGAFTLDEKFTFNNCNFYFEAGAELIIDAPGLVLMIESNFQGCTHMWKGITLSGQNLDNHFWMTGGSISDAYAGIEILDNAKLFAYGIEFNKNYMGLFSAPTISMKSYRGSPIFGCKFTSNGVMLPQYDAQPMWAPRTFAGAYISDLSYFSFLDVSSFVSADIVKNSFENISNGVIFKNVNLEIHGNEFKNIQESGTSFSIKGSECNTLSIKRNLFLNSSAPISLSNSLSSRISINTNSFLENSGANENGDTKIRLFSIHSSEIEIDNNVLFAELKNGSAISISECNSLSGVKITNNVLDNLEGIFLISLSNVHKVLGAEGIIVDNMVDPNSNFVNVHTGIRLSDTHNFVVSSNIMKNFKEATPPYSFINSTNNLIEGNVSILNSSSLNKSSFYISNSPGNIYCCNEANNGAYGFQFRGESGDSELRSSIINDTRIGLYLNNAAIGDQNLFGNFWENENGLTTARYSAPLGSTDSYEASLFTVNPSQPGTRPISVNPTEWFDNQLGEAKLCTENNTDDTCGSDNWDGFNFVSPLPDGDPCELFKNELIELVGPKVYWHFQNQNDWVFYTYVFNNYQEIPLEYWSDCFPIPEKEINVKTVAEYYHVDKSYKEAYKPTDIEADQIRTIQIRLSNDLNEINELFAYIESNEDYQNVNEEILILENRIKVANNEIQNINSVIKQRGISQLQDLTNQISNLPSDFYFLDEQKFIMSIKVQIALNELQSVTTSQWNEIDRISNECELEYGNTVFEAQSLMNLIGVINFDNESKCELVETQKRDEDVVKKTFNVYPNPSNGIFTVLIPDEVPLAAEVKIYDVNGVQVFNNTITSQLARFEIDISGNKSGVYYLEIIDIDRSIYRKKLVFIK